MGRSAHGRTFLRFSPSVIGGLGKNIIAVVPELPPDVRFIPYLQLHEFEGLLFSDPSAFARGINQANLAGQFVYPRRLSNSRRC
jgi:hypothetical protein